MKRVNVVLSAVAFLCFFLFDNYHPEYRIRVLDLLGLAMVLLCFFCQSVAKNFELKISSGNLVFSSIVAFYIICSLVIDPSSFRGILGVSLGFFVYFHYMRLRISGDVYKKWLTRILFLSVSAFIMQGVFYFLTGEILKMVLVASGDPRVWYGGGIDRLALRLTGFFMEPNSYCLATSMLVLLRREFMNKSFDLLSYAAISTMILSLSLWGAFIGVFILVYHKFRTSKNLNQLFFRITMLLVIMFGGLFFCSMLDKGNALRITLLDRSAKIINVFNVSDNQVEGSFNDRYLSITKTINNESVSLLFGNGISTEDFQVFGGANALSFFLYSSGIVGVLIIFLMLGFLFMKYGMDIAVWILISFSSFPLVTYFYWWAWLALLISASSCYASSFVDKTQRSSQMNFRL